MKWDCGCELVMRGYVPQVEAYLNRCNNLRCKLPKIVRVSFSIVPGDTGESNLEIRLLNNAGEEILPDEQSYANRNIRTRRHRELGDDDTHVAGIGNHGPQGDNFIR